ncbi:hypothetical protein HOY82DRAFT_479218 [Tuber indicum]|nr:hypothetical protein HOY82DRAFT_479218 [Tuber indicum]
MQPYRYQTDDPPSVPAEQSLNKTDTHTNTRPTLLLATHGYIIIASSVRPLATFAYILPFLSPDLLSFHK